MGLNDVDIVILPQFQQPFLSFSELEHRTERPPAPILFSVVAAALCSRAAKSVRASWNGRVRLGGSVDS